MKNIPIYRAKMIDGDDFIIGYHYPNTQGQEHYILDVDDGIVSEIDISTLAIHLQNIIDKNGKKIFSSSREDGIGGDIIHNANNPSNFSDMIVRLSKGYVAIDCNEKGNPNYLRLEEYSNYEVIGIHK